MADRYELVFKEPGLGGSTEKSSYNGRTWSYTDRGIWKLVDTHVLEFSGGPAINVDPGSDSSVETSFDMEKVPVAIEITESES